MNRRVTIFSSFALIQFSFLITTLSVFGQHQQYLFDQANKLYEQEQYPAAIQKYLEVIHNGYESWQLYYNLGNAYYKTGQFGRAILSYERSLKLNPKNEDIQFNLQIANLSVIDKVVTPPQFFLFKWLSDIKSLWGIDTLTFIGIGFYLVTMLLIIAKIFIQKVSAQRLLTVLLVPLIFLLVIITFILVVRIHENNTLRYAIVLVDKIEVMSAPETQGTELFALHEGVKFKLEELRGDWAKIRLADGKVGWVKRATFEII